MVGRKYNFIFRHHHVLLSLELVNFRNMVSFMNRKSLYLFTRKRKEKNGKRGDNSWKEKILDMIDWLLFNFQPEVLQLYSGREQVQPYINEEGMGRRLLTTT